MELKQNNKYLWCNQNEKYIFITILLFSFAIDILDILYLQVIAHFLFNVI